MFLVILLVNIWVNFDHGVLPAGAIEIQKDLLMTNKAFGGLGSIIFIGLTVGSIFAACLFQSCNTKLLLILVVFFNACTLIMFTEMTTYPMFALSRFLTGFFQVFISIYYPVWADRFGGNHKTKTCWMSILLLSSTIGVMIGYCCTSYLVQLYNWRLVFQIEAVAAILFILILLCTPQKYLDLQYA